MGRGRSKQQLRCMSSQGSRRFGVWWGQGTQRPEPTPSFLTEILSGVIRSVKKDGEWKVGGKQNALSKPTWRALNVGTPSNSPRRLLSTGVGSGGLVWDRVRVESWVLPPVQPALEAVSPAHHSSLNPGTAMASPTHLSVYRSICLSIWTGAHHGPPKHAHFVVLLQDVRHPG